MNFENQQICKISTENYTMTIDNTVPCGFCFFPQGKGLRICDCNNLILQKTTLKTNFFKMRKKFSWTNTLELGAENVPQ